MLTPHRERDRPAHASVVEGRLPRVHPDEREAQVLPAHDADVGAPLQLVEQVEREVGHRRVAAEQGPGAVRVHALRAPLRRVEDDRIDRGLPEEVAGIGSEDEALVVVPVRQPEGAAAHGVLRERPASLRLDAFARDHGGLIQRERAQERSVGAAQLDLEPVAVERADSTDSLRSPRHELGDSHDGVEVSRRETLGAERFLEEARQAVDEVARLDLASVVEPDPPVELEHVDQAVARDGPALGDLWNRLEIRRQADERAEDLRDHDRGIRVGGESGIEGAGLLAEVAEHLRPHGGRCSAAALLLGYAGLRSGSVPGSAQPGRGERGHDDQHEGRRYCDGAELTVERSIPRHHVIPQDARRYCPDSGEWRGANRVPTRSPLGTKRPLEMYRPRRWGT